MVGRETIRFYIQSGLLPQPERRGRNVALYDTSFVDRIRLINESASKHLSVRANVRGEVVATVSSDLAEKLASWRNAEHTSRLPPTFSAPDGTNLQPHFAPLGGDRRGGVEAILRSASGDRVTAGCCTVEGPSRTRR